MIFATAGVAAIVVTLPIATYAISSQEINQIAKNITVQINNEGTTSPGGSGVIVAKEGNTYTVLTANHVVCDALDRPGGIVCSSDITYSVRTSTGKEYPVKDIKVLQKSKNDADLAVVTFEATEDYLVATLANSEQLKVTQDIYLAGFPATFQKSGAAREFNLPKGSIISFQNNALNAYSLVHDALSLTGMSGGPVFDSSGRVIAIHGLADAASQGKSGFNAAIPIHTFIAIWSQIPGATKLAIENKSQYGNFPDWFVQNWMNECTQLFNKEACLCTAQKVTSSFTYEEILQMNQVVQGGYVPPPKIVDLYRSCGVDPF
ncbi:S1 family peptidase [Nostoc sp. CALU 546]|uniref:S1 family peptidase n=1 Tax=Nostoc sp. CALU 546 TaxID=1867241 RepID=UPI003B671A44